MIGAKRKRNEGVKRAHGGSEIVNCEQLGVSNPFSQSVGCLHTTCQRLFSTRQQVVGKPDLLAGSQPLLLQRGPPRSSWRLPVPLSVFPCMMSPVRWRGKPLIARHSNYSATVKSPPLMLQGMVATLSMMAQGQMRSSVCVCVCQVVKWVGEGASLTFQVWKFENTPKKGEPPVNLPDQSAFWTSFSICNQIVSMWPQNHRSSE